MAIPSKGLRRSVCGNGPGLQHGFSHRAYGSEGGLSTGSCRSGGSRRRSRSNPKVRQPEAASSNNSVNCTDESAVPLGLRLFGNPLHCLRDSFLAPKRSRPPLGPLSTRLPARLVERVGVSAATLQEAHRCPPRAPRRPNSDEPPVKGPLESMSSRKAGSTAASYLDGICPGHRTQQGRLGGVSGSSHWKTSEYC